MPIWFKNGHLAPTKQNRKELEGDIKLQQSDPLLSTPLLILNKQSGQEGKQGHMEAVDHSIDHIEPRIFVNHRFNQVTQYDKIYQKKLQIAIASFSYGNHVYHLLVRVGKLQSVTRDFKNYPLKRYFR